MYRAQGVEIEIEREGERGRERERERGGIGRDGGCHRIDCPFVVCNDKPLHFWVHLLNTMHYTLMFYIYVHVLHAIIPLAYIAR